MRLSVCWLACCELLRDRTKCSSLRILVAATGMSLTHVAVQIADLVKADRLNRLNDVCWDVAEERAQRFGNRTLEVRPHGRMPCALQTLPACLHQAQGVTMLDYALYAASLCATESNA